jgi:hypothetical protein
MEKTFGRVEFSRNILGNQDEMWFALIVQGWEYRFCIKAEDIQEALKNDANYYFVDGEDLPVLINGGEECDP